MTWNDPALNRQLSSRQHRYTGVFLWGGSWGPIPLWEQWFYNRETTTQVYTAAALISGETFHVAHVTFIDDKQTKDCPCISLSAPVSFVMQE